MPAPTLLWPTALLLACTLHHPPPQPSSHPNHPTIKPSNHLTIQPSNSPLYSQFSGAWNAPGIWNTAPDGTGDTIPAPDDPAVSIVVQAGHNVTVPANTNYSLHNLTVASGAVLRTGVSTVRYLQVYGSEILIDGTAGGSGDGLSFDINGPSCSIAGGGTIQLARLRKDCGDPGIAPLTHLSIAANVDLSWSASASLLCDGNFSNTLQRSFNVTIASGVTVTVAGDVSIDGNTGVNNTWHDGTFTVNGTLDIADDLVAVTSSNPAGGDITYAVGSGGRIIVRSQVLGNSGGTGAARAWLQIAGGGVLELPGAGAVFSGLSATRNGFDFASGSVVEYSGTAGQTVEDLLPYAGLTASGGGSKSLEGNTNVQETLLLVASMVLLGPYHLDIAPGGSASGGSAAGYVVTNGAGELIQQVGSAEVAFPVGNAYYNPAILLNDGAADDFRVRVVDAVYANGTSGTEFDAGVVDCSWLIREQVAGGADVTMTLQWEPAQELPGFDASLCYVSFHHGGTWQQDQPGPAFNQIRSRGGLTQIQTFAVGSSGVLPVELTDFRAAVAGAEVVLYWTTASEQDNAGFDIERSGDGIFFTPIGHLQGEGHSTTQRHYTYRDTRPLPGQNYYRLRQVDGNGNVEHSPVVGVWLPPPLRLFPSPFSNELCLELPAGLQQTAASWQIRQLTGRLLAEGRLQSGQTMLQVNTAPWPSGPCVFRLQAGQEQWERIIVKY